ncbi:MAG: hypothetical protein K2J40_06285 [Ruminococcus sp.]|nr:hypothetical protein [Ruminococcus sp.]
MGDVNGDNLIDAVDASEILEYYALNSTFQPTDWSEEKIKSADIDGDGNILAADATWVLMYYAYLSVGGVVDNIADFRQYTILTEDMASYSDDIYTELSVKESYDSSAHQISLSWNPMENATGYRVDVYTDQYYDENGQPFRYSGDVQECNFTAQLPDELSAENNYRYRITPYIHYEDFEADCGKKYADGSLGTYFFTGNRPYNSVKFRVNSADLQPHDSYALYDIRYNNDWNGNPTRVNAYGSKTSGDAFYISDTDREILESFIEEHFTPEMTNYDRIIYFMNWIHDNIEYATEEQYQENTMWDGNFIKDVIELKVGQCLQYNGALAEYMAYLGYDTYMLRMYTTGGLHHYRAELNIDGIVYGMEVGDQGSDNPETGYKWMWAFDTNQPMLLVRPN